MRNMSMSDVDFPSQVGFEDELRRFYLREPLTRFMASYPVVTGCTAFVGGFGVLVLVNWWGGTLLWANSAGVKNAFLSQPADWIFVMLLNPIGIGLIGYYYDTICQSVCQLVNDGLFKLDPEDPIVSWMRKSAWLRDWPYILGTLTFVALCGLLILKTYAIWMPGVPAWYLSMEDNSLSTQGAVMVVLALCEAYILFVYVSDIIRFFFFHRRLLGNQSPNQLNIVWKHPDRAFGYAPLAVPMNYAIILAVLTIICTATFVAGPTDALLSKEAVSLNALFVIEVAIAVLALPLVVLGPVWPIISMLRQRKDEAIKKLRTEISLKNSEEDISALLHEWKCWHKGWPFLVDKRSAGVLIATMALSLSGKLGPMLLAVTHMAAPTH